MLAVKQRGKEGAMLKHRVVRVNYPVRVILSNPQLCPA